MKSKIRLNQLGYITNMNKKAVFIGNPTSFEIADAMSGKVMYAGVMTKFGYDEASGEDVSVIDFSSFALPGEYYIKAGRKRSHNFIISGRPYNQLKEGMLKAFYYNRCGATDPVYAGEYAHSHCHSKPALLFENNNTQLDVSGGWHDTGGYGKYVTTACVGLGHMLYSFMLFPAAFSKAGSIPGSSAEMPDILWECRTELEWLLKMQRRDGGVYHKVSTLRKSEYVTAEKDTDIQYVFPCSHQATAYYIAVMALAARIYSKFDKDFSDLLQSAAFSGWIWLTDHPVYKPFVNPPEMEIRTMGDAPPTDFSSIMFWTVTELYALTGDEYFATRISKLYRSVSTTDFSVNDPSGFGALAYIMCKYPRRHEIERYIHLQYRIKADNLAAESEKSGYGTSLTMSQYKYGSNITVMNNCISLIIAYVLLKCEDYLYAAADQLNYLLGKNPMNICFVTGFGSNSVTQPHHRPSAFDDIDAPVPGMVVVGANTERNDDYARWNIPANTPPAKCYRDTGFCFSTNETAINCNSAALFAAAFFDTLED